MSHLDVQSLVSGIVGTFVAAASFYDNWRRRLRERREVPENDGLYEQLGQSGPSIQEMYDEDFQSLGQAFARGDGE